MHFHPLLGAPNSPIFPPTLFTSHQLICSLTSGFLWQTLLEQPVLTRRPSWPMFLASTTPSQEPRRYRRIPSSLYTAHLVLLLMSKPFFFLSLLSSYGHLFNYFWQNWLVGSGWYSQWSVSGEHKLVKHRATVGYVVSGHLCMQVFRSLWRHWELCFYLLDAKNALEVTPKKRNNDRINQYSSS